MDTQTTIKRAMRVIPEVLGANGLTTDLKWIATQRDGRRYLFGVVDVSQAIRATGSLKPYCAPSLTHDMSTLMNGRPVILGNHSGLRYCVLLSDPPRLPANASLPDAVPTNALPIGVDCSGAILARPNVFLNALVTGAQGSGKSTFIKGLAFTALLRHGWQVFAADAEGHTFNPEAWNAATAAPVAETPPALMALIATVDAELEQRADLYRALARDGLMPPNLDAYNREAAKAGLTRLPYMLFVADEANSFFDLKGVAEALADVARRGRKWGLVMVLSAHSWREKDVTRTLSALLPTRVCFRVADDTSGTVVLGSRTWGKRAMAFARPGRGVLLLNSGRRLFQAYSLDEARERTWLGMARAGERPAPILSAVEKQALAAACQNGGRMTISLVQQATGLSERQAEKLLAALRERGWLRKDGQQNNAHVLTKTAPRARAENATTAPARSPARTGVACVACDRGSPT